MNVPVIEGNEQNLYLVRYLLEAHGHRVVKARSGHASPWRGRCRGTRHWVRRRLSQARLTP